MLKSFDLLFMDQSRASRIVSLRYRARTAVSSALSSLISVNGSKQNFEDVLLLLSYLFQYFHASFLPSHASPRRRRLDHICR